MPLFPADVPEVLVSVGRDEEAKDHYRTRLAGLLQRLGRHSPRVREYTRHVNAAADVMYYLLTNGAGQQTLGEEYVGLIQITDHRRPPRYRVPALPYRLLMSLLQGYGPLLTETLLSRSRELRRLLDGMRVQPGEVPALVIGAHAALFYVIGSVPHLSKRLLGIGYKSIRPESSPLLSSFFKYLGWFLLIQFAYKLYNIWYLMVEQRNGSRSTSRGSSTSTFVDENYVVVEESTDRSLNGLANENDSKFVDESTAKRADLEINSDDGNDNESETLSTIKCPLCLTEGNWLAACQCGHVFCYECILQYLMDNDSCPICRCLIDGRGVIPLVNV